MAEQMMKIKREIEIEKVRPFVLFVWLSAQNTHMHACGSIGAAIVCDDAYARRTTVYEQHNAFASNWNGNGIGDKNKSASLRQFDCRISLHSKQTSDTCNENVAQCT